MLFLSLYVLVVIVMFVVTVRTRPDGRAVVVRARLRPPQERAAPVPAGTGTGTAPRGAERPESLEGMLAALVVAGEITGNQYRLAVEELAAQDAAGHPLTVPPDQ